MPIQILTEQGGLTRCGCERDGDTLLGDHLEQSKAQSTKDRGNVHHYPVGKLPGEWCMSCARARPCGCDTRLKPSSVKKTSKDLTNAERQAKKGKKR